jgi:hypothetical protein
MEATQASLPKAAEAPPPPESPILTRDHAAGSPPSSPETARRFTIFPTSRELPELLFRPCLSRRWLTRFLHGIPHPAVSFSDLLDRVVR